MRLGGDLSFAEDILVPSNDGLPRRQDAPVLLSHVFREEREHLKNILPSANDRYPQSLRPLFELGVENDEAKLGIDNMKRLVEGINGGHIEPLGLSQSLLDVCAGGNIQSDAANADGLPVGEDRRTANQDGEDAPVLPQGSVSVRASVCSLEYLGRIRRGALTVCRDNQSEGVKAAADILSRITEQGEELGVNECQSPLWPYLKHNTGQESSQFPDMVFAWENFVAHIVAPCLPDMGCRKLP